MFSRKVYKAYGAAMSLITTLVLLCILVALGACRPMSQSASQLPTETAFEIEANPTGIVATFEVASETDTPMPTATANIELTPLSTEPATTPSQTPEPRLETETVSATLALTLEPEPAPVTGYLFVYNPVGIQKVTLANSTFQNLLTAEADWLDWGAGFAQNKKHLAYWIKTAQRTELWFTSLPEWQPQRILEIEEVAYDFATPIWGVNDRYLLLVLSVLDNSGPLENIKTIRTYIIDMETMELVDQSYWPGNCSILAASPQTSQLALWCYKTEEDGSVDEFLVLEPEANPWLTQQSPDTLIDDCLIYLICAWSQDGELVAYVFREDHPDSLFYAMIENPIPVTLYDERTKYYTFPAWSPNSQFLFYAGACAEAGIQCPNVMSLANHEIIWRAKDYDNWGEEDINVVHVVWSPDSRYLALPISVGTDSGTEGQVLFFDVMAQEEVSRIEEIDGVILGMVWVAN